MPGAVGIVLTLAACGGVYAGYENLALLRGSVLWDLRYVLLGIGAVLVLSLAEWLSARIAAVLVTRAED